MRLVHTSGLASTLAMALVLAGCGAPETAADTSETPAETEQSTESASTGTEEAAKAPEAGKADTAESEKAAEEAKTTEELKNSVAKGKADASQIRECKASSAPGDWEYEGECDIFGSGGDSFSMRRVDGKQFDSGEYAAGFMEIIIQADTPTAANLSVRTKDGEMVNLGTAFRDSDSAECWINDSLDVCVQNL